MLIRQMGKVGVGPEILERISRRDSRPGGACISVESGREGTAVRAQGQAKVLEATCSGRCKTSGWTAIQDTTTLQHLSSQVVQLVQSWGTARLPRIFEG